MLFGVIHLALSRYDFVVLYTRGAKAPIAAEIAKQPLNLFRLGKSAIRNGPRNVRRLWNTDSEFSADDPAGQLWSRCPTALNHGCNVTERRVAVLQSYLPLGGTGPAQEGALSI